MGLATCMPAVEAPIGALDAAGRVRNALQTLARETIYRSISIRDGSGTSRWYLCPIPKEIHDHD
jgi:hypothetical protein